VSIVIETARLPLLPGVTAIASQNRSGGLGTNREHFGAFVSSEGVDASVLDLCYDPQTSGGLLAAVAAASADEIASALGEAGVPTAIVGDVRAGAPHILLK
jgi:selenide,water dikinase